MAFNRFRSFLEKSMKESVDAGSFSPRTRRIALFLAPVLAFLLYLILPTHYTNQVGELVEFSHAGRACLCVVLWMAIWWLMEPVHIAITALLPLVAFPLLGVTTAAKAMAPYASDTIFLFMGGFLIAAGVQRWGLDKRIALTTLKYAGTKPDHIVGGLMFASAFISMWVSNTATAAMMVPIAMAVLNLVRESEGGTEITTKEKNFGIAVLLAIAYGASIGGMATIIGSPPNGIYARFVTQTYGEPVTLLEWMKVGLPVTVLLLPLTWLILTKFLFRNSIDNVKGGAQWINSELEKLGPLSKGEHAVMYVFFLAVFLWTFGSLIRGISFNGVMIFKPMTDSVIAMLAGILLFAIPIDEKTYCLDWENAKDISWDTLLLFGGGLSMAAALQATGSGALLGAKCAGLAGLPTWIVIVGISSMVVFVTNFTSNTALAATLIPLFASVAPVMGVPAHTMLMVTALSASGAFLMPVGTPPNAIIFGTGRIKIMQMVRAGFFVSFGAIGVISLVSVLILD